MAPEVSGCRSGLMPMEGGGKGRKGGPALGMQVGGVHTDLPSSLGGEVRRLCGGTGHLNTHAAVPLPEGWCPSSTVDWMHPRQVPLCGLGPAQHMPSFSHRTLSSQRAHTALLPLTDEAVPERPLFRQTLRAWTALSIRLPHRRSVSQMSLKRECSRGPSPGT